MNWGLKRPRWVDQWLFAWWSWWQTRRGFDVVHSHENVFHGQVQTVHVLPVIHNLFDGRTGWRRLATWLKVLLSPRLMAYVLLERLRFARAPHRLVVAASDPLAQVLARRFDWLPGQLQVLPPGVRLPEPVTPQVKAQQRQQARLALQLPEQATLLLMIGHDYRKKGLGALLQALSLLPESVHLVVVGQPTQLPQWQPVVDKAGLTPRVHFLGALKDTRHAYEACDVMVHATLEDTFGMVTIEAMAHRLPLLVSRAPYCLSSSQLQHEQQALILQDPTSAQEIADQVTRVLSDAGLCARLQSQGHAYASRYAWPVLAQQQAALYRLACQGEP
jgi:UDP-glucose:(heptosyl)LPS alpha-1,3-glucosyltransferase